MVDVIRIPKALFEGDYVTWNFECPHCKSLFTHYKGDLGIKTCASCHQFYACDNAGGILKIGEVKNFVYNGKEFVPYNKSKKKRK